MTEQQIGGANFVRADVPETVGSKPFTKLFGVSAIYSMTPIEEDVARALATQYDQRPVSVYELPADVRQAMNSARRITGPADPPERGADPDGDFGDDNFDDSPS